MSFDAFAWFEYFQGGPHGERVRRYVGGSEVIVTSAVSLFELKRKYLREGKTFENRVGFVRSRSHVVELSAEIALLAAELSHAHRLAAADSLIYATAQQAGAPLLTGDSDLKGLTGVEFLG